MPAFDSAPRELLAGPGDSGMRLDRFIATQCPELSRTRVQELIESGVVLVAGRAAKGALRLRGGERITVQVQPRPPMHAQAESIALDVLYEDDDVIVINKAAGMTVHAGSGNTTGTLVNALLGRGQTLSQSADGLRPGIVHRLDKNTSGVILVAKNDAAHAKLGEAFHQRTVKKSYIALVQGVLESDTGRIDLAIGRDPINRVRMTARRVGILSRTREARTDWRVLIRIANTTLVEVQLHTGRTHQIRVHFSALRHPVVGDTLYGADSELTVTSSGGVSGTTSSGARSSGAVADTSAKREWRRGASGEVTLPPLGRNFLHAAKLGFAQPSSGEWIEVRATLPVELRDFLRELAAAAGEDSRRIDAALAGYL